MGALSRRRLVVLVSALASVVIAAVAVLWVSSRGPSAAQPLPSGTVSSSPGASAPAAGPSATASGSPTAGALPAPTATDAAGIVAAVQEIESGQKHAAPVTPGAPVEVAQGVQLAVEKVEPVDGQGQGPGEVSGPSFAITVKVTNGGPAVSLDEVVVNVYGDDGRPGSLLLGDPRGSPLQGELAPGASAEGTYVLTRPGDASGTYVITVSLGADSQTAVVTVPPKAG